MRKKGNKVKTFWKDLTDKQRKELLTRFISVILSGIILVAVGVASFAWFATNTTVGHTGMQITVSNETVDVLIERTTVYDTGYDGISGLKSKFTASGYSTNATSTGIEPVLAYELENEYVYDGKRYMQPGAYGTVTFYLKPKNGYDGVVTFDFERGGFADGYYDDDDDEETPPVPTITEIDDTDVLNLLKGHILFFTGRTGATHEDYVYSGLIDGDSFSYDISEHSTCSDEGTIAVYNGEGNRVDTCNKSDCYKIVLYWEWPITYGDIKDYTSTTEPAVTKKYPAELNSYLENNAEYFFVGADLASDEAKSNAYNDGDQAIGDAVNYFALYLTLQ